MKQLENCATRVSLYSEKVDSMSVLDLDFYKLTMLQFIWKHYADVPVTFRLHSRKQDLSDIVHPVNLQRRTDKYRETGLSIEEAFYLKGLGFFEDEFIRDLAWLSQSGLPEPMIGSPHTAPGFVEVYGNWFNVSLWETVILSMVTEQYSRYNVDPPNIHNIADISKVMKSGASWADFGTRRRWSYDVQNRNVLLASNMPDSGFIGTSNVDIARKTGVKPVGTYAHELEMVLRPYFDTEFETTRDILRKWGEMYPRELRIALTDTYTTPTFFNEHGKFLLDNDWRGVRLDSGNPFLVGKYVDEWLSKNRSSALDPMDVVFSDGLDADAIVGLQQRFHQDHDSPATFINPVFGWGTGFTNPNSDLSLVMKAVESNGTKTYKITDDESKSIR